MAADDVKITISAENQASAAINQASQDLTHFTENGREFAVMTREQVAAGQALNDSLQQQIDADQALRAAEEAKTSATQGATAATNQAATAADKSKESHLGLAGAFTAAQLAADTVEQGISKVSQTVTQAVDVAAQYQRALQGAQTVGAQLGQSTDQVTAAVQRLSQNGLMNTAQAADTLRNIMQRGFNVDQAQQLAQAFQDIGAFGKQGEVTLGDAVENASDALRTQRSVTEENMGVMPAFQQMWQRYADQLGVNVNTLTDAQKNQAEFNSIVNEGNQYLGNASLYAQTAAGQQEIYANSTLNAQAALGNALIPAITLFRQGVMNGLMPATQDAATNMVGLQQVFLSLMLPISEAADAVIGFGRVMVGLVDSISSGSMTPLQDAWKTTVDSMNTTWTNYLDDMDKAAAGGFNSLADQAAKEAAQEAAIRTQAQRQMDQQIADATKSYQEANQQRLDSFQESLTQMVLAHENKVESIKAQIADEEDAYEQATQRRTENYNDQVESLEDSHAQKVGDIQKQISDEQANRVEKDGILYHVANQAKLDDLQQQLDRENAAYDKQMAKLKKNYDQDAADAQASHDKKLSALQQSLDAEQAILEAHAADVARVNQQTAEDDISKLERKYATENTLADQHFADQLAKIRRAGQDQGSAFIQGIGDGATGQSQAAAGKLTVAGNNLMSSFTAGVRSGALGLDGVAGGGKTQSFSDIVSSAFKGVGATVVASLFGPIFGLGVNKLLGFAEGGVIDRHTILSDARTGLPYAEMAEGDRPEAIVPMNGTSRGGSGKQVTINQYNTINQPMDLSQANAYLSYALSRRI